MNRVASFALVHNRAVLIFWTLIFVAGLLLALRLDAVPKVSSDTIPGSPSDRVTQAMQRTLGKGSAYPFEVLLQSDSIATDDVRFSKAAGMVEHALSSSAGVRSVRSYWNTGSADLIGRDHRSALFLVAPDAADFSQAEMLTDSIRTASRSAGVGMDFAVTVTGTVAMFHDLNRDSSSDLLHAERIGIPITIVILLLVFGAPVAAALPLILACISVVVSSAGLYLLSHVMAVSVFAQNAITMIGLGIGVDYALFMISSFREELRRGATPANAADNALVATGHSILFSGITVGIGFLSLLLVHARFFYSLALGGTMVMIVSLATTLSLLPVLLAWCGNGINWPRGTASTATQASGRWEHWALSIMRHPWTYIAAAMLILAVFIAPVARLHTRNFGARDLDAGMEARRGFESLQQNFAGGWMGPVPVLVESNENPVWSPENSAALLRLGARLERDPRVASIQGLPQVIASLTTSGYRLSAAAGLPASIGDATQGIVSLDGRTGVLVIVPKEPPEHADVQALVADLRSDAWPELNGKGMHAQVGGATAMVADFNQEMTSSLWRVIPAVLALTFASLLALFRSVLIPLKAIVLNLLSVLAAYGFLVYLFQEGYGAGLIGLTAPGGLNSFIVLMLFTILFGLSMDYEVFLLAHIAEEYHSTGDNRAAVASGLRRTAGVITSAALIMVCLFASFGFTRLVPTREFGLGLAFAVLLDATLIRLLLVPAFMALFGAANWWAPSFLRRRG